MPDDGGAADGGKRAEISTAKEAADHELVLAFGGPARHPRSRRGVDRDAVDGDDVVVPARYTATNKATGASINVRVAHHFVVRGGLIVRFEQSPTRPGCGTRCPAEPSKRTLPNYRT